MKQQPTTLPAITTVTRRTTRQTQLFAILLLAALGTLAVLGCGGGETSAINARLIELGKKVEVNLKQAVKEQKLALSDVIEVFENSFAVIKFADGTRCNLYYDDLNKRNAKIEVAACRPKDFTTIAFKLVSGVVSVLVPPKRTGTDRYEIETAQTITAIKGTMVKITTDGSGDIIALKEGSVEITHRGSSEKLHLQAGTQVAVTAAGFQPVKPYIAVSEAEESFFSDNPKELYRY